MKTPVMRTLAPTSLRLVAAVCFFLLLPAWAQLSQDPETVVATVDGRPIKEKDLNISPKLIRLQQQAYQARLEALDEFIGDRLVEKAAAEQGMTTPEFLRHEIDRKVEEPTEEEVSAFYEAQKSRIKQPLEAIRDQIVKFLKSDEREELQRQLIDGLRKKSEVAVMLTAPRMRFSLENSPRRGPAGSPVTIVEYSDFQCPYCRRVQPTLLQVLDKYGDKVSLVYKDLPLRQIHPQAQKAAEAARCGGDQGKFWEYHDKLFERSRIRKSDFAAIATEIGLNTLSFGECLDSGKNESLINADLDEAVSLGVQSTPIFFVNGIEVKGALPLSDFSKIIDAELASPRSAAE